MTFNLAIAATLGAVAPAQASAPADAAVLAPQNRRMRGNQVALDVSGGSVTGRAIGLSFIVGGRATYFPIRQLGIGAAYGFSRGIGGIDTVRGRSIHLVNGQLEIPMFSALRVGRRKVAGLCQDRRPPRFLTGDCDALLRGSSIIRSRAPRPTRCSRESRPRGPEHPLLVLDGPCDEHGQAHVYDNHGQLDRGGEKGARTRARSRRRCRRPPAFQG